MQPSRNSQARRELESGRRAIGGLSWASGQAGSRCGRGKGALRPRARLTAEPVICKAGYLSGQGRARGAGRGVPGRPQAYLVSIGRTVLAHLRCACSLAKLCDMGRHPLWAIRWPGNGKGEGPNIFALPLPLCHRLLFAHWQCWPYPGRRLPPRTCWPPTTTQTLFPRASKVATVRRATETAPRIMMICRGAGLMVHIL